MSHTVKAVPWDAADDGQTWEYALASSATVPGRSVPGILMPRLGRSRRGFRRLPGLTPAAMASPTVKGRESKGAGNFSGRGICP